MQPRTMNLGKASLTDNGARAISVKPRLHRWRNDIAWRFEGVWGRRGGEATDYKVRHSRIAVRVTAVKRIICLQWLVTRFLSCSRVRLSFPSSANRFMRPRILRKEDPRGETRSKKNSTSHLLSVFTLRRKKIRIIVRIPRRVRFTRSLDLGRSLRSDLSRKNVRLSRFLQRLGSRTRMRETM